MLVEVIIIVIPSNAIFMMIYVSSLPYRPDIKKLSPENSVENNQLAFSVAEKHLGISSLIKPAEMDQPDRLALVTYLSLFYELFQDSKPATPPNEAGNSIEPPASKAHSVPTKESTPYKELKSSHDKTTSKKKSDLTVKPVTKFTDSAKKGNSSHEDHAAHSSSELQIASTKKSQSIVEAQATSGVVTPTRKKTAVAEKESASSDMQASVDVPLAKHKSSASKPDDQVTPSVEPPVKTKKKKRKFRLFRRRNKKTNLATATPSVERYTSQFTSIIINTVVLSYNPQTGNQHDHLKEFDRFSTCSIHKLY